MDDRTDPDMRELADSSEEDDDESADRIPSLVSSSGSEVEEEVAGGTTCEDHDWLSNHLQSSPEKYTEPLLEPSDERVLVLPDVALDLESKRVELALVDSGYFAQVCPISFGAD